MRFWRESSARWGLASEAKKLTDEGRNFLFSTNDCFRARFTPKPGHIALSPRRSGS
jgi:hypothetical protein